LPKLLFSLLVVFLVAVFVTVMIPILEGQYGTISGKPSSRKCYKE
jgi:hypothetical protein